MSDNKTATIYVRSKQRYEALIREISALYEDLPTRLSPEEWAAAILYLEKGEGERPAYIDRIGTIGDGGSVYEDTDIDGTSSRYYDRKVEGWYKSFLDLFEYYDDVIKDVRRSLGIEDEDAQVDIVSVLASIPDEWIVEDPRIAGRKWKLNLHLFDAAQASETKQEESDEQTGRIGPLDLIPTGPAFAYAYEIMANRGISLARRGEKLPVRSGDRITYELIGRSTRSVVAMDEKFFSKEFRSRTFLQTWTYSLQLLAKTALSQGWPKEIDIDLQDLVNLGIYSTTSNARSGINRFWDRQVLLKIGGTISSPREGGEEIVSSEGVLFYNIKTNGRGHVKLSVNENIDPLFFNHFAGPFPSWAYQLDLLPFLLVIYAFYSVRQQRYRTALERDGFFSFVLDDVRERLGLPSVEKVRDEQHRKYKENIIRPITDAIDAINEVSSRATVPGEFEIRYADGVDTSDVHSFLQGSIEIHLSGDYAAPYIEINKSERRQIQQEQTMRSEREKRSSGKRKK